MCFPGGSALRSSIVILFVAMPIAVAAQQSGNAPRIGYLSVGPTTCKPDSRYEAFVGGLRDLGYVLGRTVTVDHKCHSTPGDMSKLTREMLERKANIIVVGTPAAALAARTVTGEIPIVCASCGDPLDNGLVASLARPGGNVTGMASLSAELMGKRLELVKEVAPRAARVAALLNPDNPGTRANRVALTTAARALGVEIYPVEFRNVGELDDAFRSAAAAGAGALLVQDDPYAFAGRARIAELGLKHRLATVAGVVEIAEAGALIAYGPNRLDLYRRSAGFVDRIIKGARPADLPIEQPSKFELIINLKTAAAIGITLPASLVLRADRIIQ